VHTKLNVSSFILSRDIEGSQNYKNRSRDVCDAPCDLLLHFFGLQADDQSAH